MIAGHYVIPEVSINVLYKFVHDCLQVVYSGP